MFRSGSYGNVSKQAAQEAAEVGCHASTSYPTSSTSCCLTSTETRHRSSVPYREPRPVHCCRMKFHPRLPRTGALCKLLAVLVGCLVVFHAVSCGYFFCVRFPGPIEFPSSIYDDIRDVYRLTGGPRVLWSRDRDPYTVDESPALIPKLIHQTYKSSSVPSSVRPYMQSWRRQNDGWEIRFYDDEACLKFVQREFPEYLAAYRQLPKDVERSDFFRYMVVLRLGGVYADVDTECRRPLNEVIRPRDTLIVGWENEFPSREAAIDRNYIRTRQVLQWVFAAAPGHPALREICDHIARNALRRFSEQSNMDTLERTGPGIWTDIILKQVMLHPPAKKDDPWNVRMLPRVLWGVHPMGLDGISAGNSKIVVLHHFLGSWKVRGWKRKGLDIARFLIRLFTASDKPTGQVDALAPPPPVDDAETRLYPVSVEWQPPFTMMTNLMGHGDPQAGTDVNAVITAWGTWQPAIAPTRSPSVSDALIGSLGAGRPGHRKVFLDVGAAQGFFSLAAAARGHTVHAFELSPNSLEALEASIQFNGFQSLITVHQVALGAQQEVICVDRAGSQPDVDMLRGYSASAAHNASSGAGGECIRTAQRTVAAGALPPGTQVGAVRISAAGWEGHIVEGLKGLIESSPPGVILLEFQPSKMAATGYSDPVEMLRRLYDWGYTDISHSGYVCDERWLNITKSIRLRGAMGLAAQEALKQPTWCRLQPEHFETLAQRATPRFPENLLLTYKTEAAAAASQQGGQVMSGPPAVAGARSGAARVPSDAFGLDGSRARYQDMGFVEERRRQ